MEIKFKDVRLGERFCTPRSKRLMTCVKIAPTEVTPGDFRNTVILLNHVGTPADDLGALITFADDTPVAVDRQP